MDIALLLARVLVAVVFTIAGAAKLADIGGSRQAMRDFGVPRTLATLLGTVLPLAELAIAFALIPRSSSWWGALAALALLLAFVSAIGTSLAHGRKPDCHCFGQVHSAPAGWPTMVRNTALATVAVFIVAQGQDSPGASVIGWTGDLTTMETVAVGIGLLVVALAAVEGWAVIHLLGQNGRLFVRIDELEARLMGASMSVSSANPEPDLVIGTLAPAFTLPDVHGETWSLDVLRRGRETLLVAFTDTACAPCNALLPDLGRWQVEYADRLEVIVISRGTAEAIHANAIEHGLARVLLDQDLTVAKAYGTLATPAAVLVRPDGTIGAPFAGGTVGIRSMVARLAGHPSPARMIPLHPVSPHANGTSDSYLAAQPTLKIGEPAPILRLPNLDGNTIELSSFKGNPTLVLFWNPGCSFCARMLDDLKAWETNLAAGVPRMLVVSSGNVETNRAMGLRSTVVLDQNFSAGRAFGAAGTPAAVMIDEAGNVASGITVGAPAILALAGTVQEEAPMRGS